MGSDGSVMSKCGTAVAASLATVETYAAKLTVEVL